ncbi:MAG: AAC(3) family N-acetyltransferase [Kiritimatiellaeota bacterium]|nr:AAC(3) family N-acetyltransferase [Kiritimatiellota bacterium]
MTRIDIAAELTALGLRRGDIVLLHSSLSSLGHVEGGADALIDAFLDVLGPEGTLVVPTFGALGIVTEHLRARAAAIESCHPRARVAAVGKDAAEICADHWKAETAHGAGTPYTRIAARGGYVCLLGVDQDRNTTLHTVEALLRLPYLKTTSETTFETPEGTVARSWKYFPGPHRDFIGLDRVLRESGKLRIGRIGSAVVRLIRSRDLIDISLEVGRRDPAFVLCDNPNCTDCVLQRAALRQDRFSREHFTPVAAAGLAGRYVPEIVENVRAAGVTGIELDMLEGKPVQALNPDKLAGAIGDFREAGCPVASLRFSAVPNRIESVLEIAAAAAVPRLVLPLSHLAERFLATAVETGITLSFFNIGMAAEAAAELLLDLRKRGLPARFTFNAANFARAGEKPFLHSFRTKVRRFVDQLDVEDCLFDGRPTPLARGNAEVKELISILRCTGFSGPLVLGTGNRPVADLRETVARFDELLQAM